MYKWIFAIFGYTFFRLPGALLGYFLGSLLGKNKINTLNRFSSFDFEINLLALSSLVIKSDGKITNEELNFVRSYFVSSYGKERANSVTL